MAISTGYKLAKLAKIKEEKQLREDALERFTYIQKNQRLIGIALALTVIAVSLFLIKMGV